MQRKCGKKEKVYNNNVISSIMFELKCTEFLKIIKNLFGHPQETPERLTEYIIIVFLPMA